tara:strand:+ start:4098 stop:4850 length:753 start_codon:yes stop_codon:yes gene_type:complete
MKLINKYKSPNFNLRKKNCKIKYIILHYTSIDNVIDALDHLCKEKNKVSCHYLISQSGKIYHIVNENFRAWHAGISNWNGETDINSSSIGIELDFSYDGCNNHFNDKMIKSLIYLLKKLVKKYKIKPFNILGHSDITPLRKKDPGYKFPWKKLNMKKLAFIPNQINLNNIYTINKWIKKNKINSRKKAVIILLNILGYDISLVYKNNFFFKKLIINYQSHYLQNNLSGKIDKTTFIYIKNHCANYLLTLS